MSEYNLHVFEDIVFHFIAEPRFFSDNTQKVRGKFALNLLSD